MNVYIWKFELPVDFGDYVLEFPKCAEFLTVQVQREKPMLWARVQDVDEKAKYLVSIMPTGDECNKTICMQYVGTFQMYNGFLVYHVFIKRL